MKKMKYWICNKCGMLNDINKLTCRNCTNTKSHLCPKHGYSTSDKVEFKTPEERDKWIRLMKKNMGAKVWYSP